MATRFKLGQSVIDTRTLAKGEVVSVSPKDVGVKFQVPRRKANSVAIDMRYRTEHYPQGTDWLVVLYKTNVEKARLLRAKRRAEKQAKALQTTLPVSTD